jgi:hypothetical protein
MEFRYHLILVFKLRHQCTIHRGGASCTSYTCSGNLCTWMALSVQSHLLSAPASSFYMLSCSSTTVRLHMTRPVPYICSLAYILARWWVNACATAEIIAFLDSMSNRAWRWKVNNNEHKGATLALSSVRCSALPCSLFNTILLIPQLLTFFQVDSLCLHASYKWWSISPWADRKAASQEASLLLSFIAFALYLYLPLKLLSNPALLLCLHSLGEKEENRKPDRPPASLNLGGTGDRQIN